MKREHSKNAWFPCATAFVVSGVLASPQPAGRDSRSGELALRGLETGAAIEHVDAGPLDSQRFLVDPNAGGRAAEIRLVELAWGRLVDVYGLDSAGEEVFQQRDFVVTPGLVSDGMDFLLEEDPVLGDPRLVILRDVTDGAPGGGLDQFVDLLRLAESGLAPVAAAGPGAAHFSMVPRNATLVARFDDLLDADLVTAANLRLRVGDPPVATIESRVVADRNHGALTVLPGERQRRFFTTRVLLDVALSSLESAAVALPPNPLGFPAAADATRANVGLAIPSREDASAGQPSVLRNPTGGASATSGNGFVDFASPTADVLRLARSGGPTSVTGDAFNGFLAVVRPPRVVGTQAIEIGRRPRPDGTHPLDFVLRQIRFESVPCARAPVRGDVIAVAGFLARLRSPATVRPDGQAFGLEVRLLGGDPDAFRDAAIGPAAYLTEFDPLSDADRAACFVTILPTPDGYPDRPTSRIDPNSTFAVAFNEPMDPLSMEPHEALALTRKAVPGEGRDWVVGRIEASLQLDRFTFVPGLPLPHLAGETEGVWLAMGGGARAPRDLAGNPVLDVLPQVAHRIAADAPTFRTDGRVTRFADVDEEPPFGDVQTGPLPEWGGQFLYDLAGQAIRPRPVTRFQGVVDRNQALPGIMNYFPNGLPTPLNPLGSKLQAVWRYVDLGFSLSDPTNYNLDVEGLSWSPRAGQVVADQYAQFEMRLAHSSQLPDERIDLPSLFPKYPASGIGATYADNPLFGEPVAVVHPKPRGYDVNPGDLFLADNGTPLLPFPMNRGLPPDEAVTYTWRDTAITRRSAFGGDGADPEQVLAAGLPREHLYSKYDVQSVGLPLLMEFRCYPDSGAVGLNSFDVSFAVNSSARPAFRAFSSGGISSGGSTVLVDPDLETHANGGFNPYTEPPGGLDPIFYHGAADFVVRVSRVVSVWFTTDTSTTLNVPDPQYAAPLLYPPAHQQPPGTSIEVRYRSAQTIAATSPATASALTLDAYGDHYDPGVKHDPENANLGFGPMSLSWLSAPIDGWRYYQMRLTFRANPVTGLTPELSSIGQGWSE